MNQETKEEIFNFIYGWTSNLDDLSDGAYWAMHGEAYDSAKEEFGIDNDSDWFDIQQEYLAWKEKQGD